MTCHVVLFEGSWRSLTGVLIMCVTRSRYSHAAVNLNGRMVDASESRGNVGETTALDLAPSRRVRAFEVDLRDPVHRNFIKQHMGAEYDWAGVLGWLFRANSRRRFYCFEFAYQFAGLGLKTMELRSVSARHLLSLGMKEVFDGQALDYKTVYVQ